jgi:SAM-dependent methyltransferase
MVNSFSEAYHAQSGKYVDKWAFYLDAYGHFLDPIRDKISHVLEIGVQNGGSLEVWARYFPNVTHVIGCDIDPACGELAFSDPRISVVVGDASQKQTQKKVLEACPTFDLIIDDGSHRQDDVITAFWAYFPHVSYGGYMIIEDLHTSYWQGYGGGLSHPESSMQFLKLLADIVNFEHWGIPGRRADALAGFSAGKNFVNEQTVAEVLSVTFLNSLCIIRKVDKGQRSEMGLRLGAGTETAVASFPVSKRNKARLKEDQSQNPAASIEDLSLVQLRRSRDDLARQVASLAEANNELLASTSWRITRPLRAIKSLFTSTNG